MQVHGTPPAVTDFLWVNLVNVLVLGCASGQVLLPEHLHRSGLTQWQIGMIWAAFACAAILIRFQLGRWLVHWGQLPFYRAGAIVVALCQTCYAVMQPSAPLLLFLRSLEGVALASYFTAVWSRVIDASPPGRVGKTTGLFGISGLCAGAVGPWALERVAVGWDYPTAFACAALAGWLGVIFSFRFRHEAKCHSDGSAPQFWKIASAASMRSTVLTSWLFGMTLGIFNTFVVVYAFRTGLAPVGPMFLLYTLCSVLVRLRVGHLSDRWHPKWIIVPSLTLLSAACALLGALKGWPLYPLFLLAGAGVGSAHGMIYPAISNLALQRANSSSNSAAAVFTAAMDLGNLMGCAAAGWLAHYRGHSPVFLALSGILALGASGVWWLEKDRSGGP